MPGSEYVHIYENCYRLKGKVPMKVKRSPLHVMCKACEVKAKSELPEVVIDALRKLARYKNGVVTRTSCGYAIKVQGQKTLFIGQNGDMIL